MVSTLNSIWAFQTDSRTCVRNEVTRLFPKKVPPAKSFPKTFPATIFAWDDCDSPYDFSGNIEILHIFSSIFAERAALITASGNLVVSRRLLGFKSRWYTWSPPWAPWWNGWKIYPEVLVMAPIYTRYSIRIIYIYILYPYKYFQLAKKNVTKIQTSKILNSTMQLHVEGLPDVNGVFFPLGTVQTSTNEMMWNEWMALLNRNDWRTPQMGYLYTFAQILR